MDICIECKHHDGPKATAPAHQHQCNKFHEECRVIREMSPIYDKCIGFEKADKN